MELLLKRAYEPAEATDGYRVLVDRLWPRGLSKERAQIDEWAKELAPSTELRQWFGHVPSRWEEFTRDYRAELEGSTAGREFVTRLQDEERITLVYAAHDETHCHPLILRDYLEHLISPP